MNNPFFSDEELSAIRHAEQVGISQSGRYGLDWFSDQACPIYFFGCGGFVASVREKLSRLSLGGYLDNDKSKQGLQIGGLPVLSPSDEADMLRREKALVVISVASGRHAAEIEKQCRDLELKCIDWGMCWPAFEEKAPLRDLAENQNAIACTDIWADVESRKVYRDIVRFRTTFSKMDAPRITEPQYFIPEIPENFFVNIIDAGAYDGDTLRGFLARYGGNFENYFAFEPLPGVRQKLEATVSIDPRIHLYNKGLSDFSGKSRLSDRDTSSKLNDNVGMKVDVVRLDDLFLEFPITFLKMDIEGEELAALRGSRRLIAAHRPALAISAYHVHSHLWEIPRYIESLDLGYNLFLRHHSRFLSETVCYAIPNN